MQKLFKNFDIQICCFIFYIFFLLLKRLCQVKTKTKTKTKTNTKQTNKQKKRLKTHTWCPDVKKQKQQQSMVLYKLAFACTYSNEIQIWVKFVT